MPIEHVTAIVMLASLVVYALLGGADFGAGVWDLLASGPRKARQREQLAHAIAPVWEANHVWLILVIVLLFTGFPAAFAAIMTALHVPVTLVLIGIVLRGTSFTFRAYGNPDPRTRHRWGLVFSIASIATPILLGVTLATIARGRLHWEGEVYVSGFFEPWLHPFPWAVGVLTLAIFAHLAAVYLCVETRDHDLREDFRARALGSAAAVAIAALVAFMLSKGGAPTVHHELGSSWWTWPLVGTAILAAIGVPIALVRRRYVVARTLAAAEATLIIVGFEASLFPYLVVPQFTIEGTAAPAQVHRLMLIALGAGAVILLPSLYILMRVFKGERSLRLVDKS